MYVNAVRSMFVFFRCFEMFLNEPVRYAVNSSCIFILNQPIPTETVPGRLTCTYKDTSFPFRYQAGVNRSASAEPSAKSLQTDVCSLLEEAALDKSLILEGNYWITWIAHLYFLVMFLCLCPPLISP